MKLRREERVAMEVAQERALARLDTYQPVPASYVADGIWPDHRMTGQGAGAAASRVLKRLEDQGLAYWKSDGVRYGWVRSVKSLGDNVKADERVQRKSRGHER